MKNSIYTSLLILFIVIPKMYSQTDEKTDSIQTIKSVESTTEKKHPLLQDKFIINAGLYFPSKTLKIRADGASENDEIEFNKAFDLDQNEMTFAANIHWRFSKKWHLGVEYFGVKNNNSKTIDTEIEIEDVVYPIGASVAFEANLNMFRVYFGRVISKGQKHELGAGLGAHLMDIKTSLEGEAYVDDSNTDFQRKSVSVIAPLPNIGIWYIYTPTEKWALTARIDWFGIEIEDYSGSLWNIAPGIKYQVFKNIGIGLNYRYFSTKFDVDSDKWSGGLNVIYHGPLLTVSANF